MRSYSQKYLMAMVIALILQACNSEADSMQATPGVKVLQTQDGLPNAAQPSKSSSPTTVYESDDANLSVDPLPGKLPAVNPVETETLSMPSNITGALLVCMKDKVEGNRATVVCGVQDKTTKRPIDIAGKYASHSWTFASTDNLSVTVSELPAAAYWHAQYIVSASSQDALNRGLSGLVFNFEAVSASGAREALVQNIVPNAPRIDMTFKSVRTYNDYPSYCLYNFANTPSPSSAVITTPCQTRNSAQDWFITTDSKIAHVSGICVSFNDTSSMMEHYRSCSDASAPKFDFDKNTQQIKIRGTSKCIGLLYSAPGLNSAQDYPSSVTCDANDIKQRWIIGSGISL